jgi:hypothetical protein
MNENRPNAIEGTMNHAKKSEIFAGATRAGLQSLPLRRCSRQGRETIVMVHESCQRIIEVKVM